MTDIRKSFRQGTGLFSNFSFQKLVLLIDSPDVIFVIFALAFLPFSGSQTQCIPDIERQSKYKIFPTFIKKAFVIVWLEDDKSAICH